MENLNVAIIQANLVWHNAEANRNNFSEKIKLLSNEVDLIVLPEMFTTGFTMQPNKVAETMQGETLAWMKKLALEKNTAITGSVVIEENNNYYNRLLFVFPSGEVTYYNKKHLFSYAGEDEIYSAGNDKVIITYKNWKICPLICYDLRFPVWSRNVENYDLLIYVANWPKIRVSAWNTLLKARAIENMSYVIGVNRVGKDANDIDYNGYSTVINCLGENSKILEEKEYVEIFTLDKNHLIKSRKKFNFLADKDNFKLERDS